MTENETDDRNATLFATAHMEAAELLAVVILALLLLMAIFGNALSAFVFTRRHLRHCSINMLLTALSFSDLLFASLALGVFPVMPLCKQFGGCGVDYNRATLIAYPLIKMCGTASCWLLVFITIERWLAVCKPFLVGQYCTRKRTCGLIVATLLFAIGYNLIRFWEFSYNDKKIRPQLRVVHWYILYYETVLCSIILFVVPLVVLCTLNFQVANEIRLSKESQKRLTQQQRKEHKVAQMMLYVVVVFVACTTMSMLLNILEIINPDLFMTSFGHLLNEINNVFVVLSAALNCLLYCRFSSRYWTEVQKLYLVVRHPFSFRQHWEARQLAVVRAGATCMTASGHQDTLNARHASCFSSLDSQKVSSHVRRRPTPLLDDGGEDMGDDGGNRLRMVDFSLQRSRSERPSSASNEASSPPQVQTGDRSTSSSVRLPHPHQLSVSNDEISAAKEPFLLQLKSETMLTTEML